MFIVIVGDTSPDRLNTTFVAFHGHDYRTEAIKVLNRRGIDRPGYVTVIDPDRKHIERYMVSRGDWILEVMSDSCS